MELLERGRVVRPQIEITSRINDASEVRILTRGCSLRR